ncbi:MAG: hypothetical protein M1541_05875 [Acidobacteria bacterium]|nr:hypothetical protein [Acidobacteriota bacterium]
MKNRWPPAAVEEPALIPKDILSLQQHSFLDLAGSWLLDSGIQEPSGGVARYYRSDVGVNCRVSTEITGYALSSFVFLQRLTSEPRYLEAARRAARFLARAAWDPRLGIFPFEPAGGDQAPSLAYFFDCGIIARGLLAVWRATNDAELLDAALRCADSMARDFGQVRAPHPILVLPEKTPAPREGNWSRHPGCYQLKSAMAWYDVYEATGMQRHLAHYEQALEQALSTHRSFLPGDDDPHRVMDRLHAYAYFLEGLLPRLDQAECMRAARWGIGTAARLPRQISPGFERSDVCAQILRLRLHADALGVIPLDRRAAEEEARRVASYQVSSEDSRVNGGFFFGRRNGELVPHVNPVSTVFAMQALAMWRCYLEGTFQPDRRQLI